MSAQELVDCEAEACPGCGSCQGLYTANTMACLTEALGMSLTDCGTALAVSAKKRHIAFESGAQAGTQLVDEMRQLELGFCQIPVVRSPNRST